MTYDYQLLPIEIYCDLLEDQNIDTVELREWINDITSIGYAFGKESSTCTEYSQGLGYCTAIQDHATGKGMGYGIYFAHVGPYWSLVASGAGWNQPTYGNGFSSYHDYYE